MTRAPAEVGSAASNYEILAKLATGGMAEIFLARGASAAGVERYVVLKRVHRHRASDVQFVRMFLDEARLAAQLQHPNIAQVYDIGKLGDSYFFTMEYVHGETVRALLRRSASMGQPIPIGSVLSIIAGAAAGLHHAHERKGIDGRHLGIVHRDVSPSNLMVSYEGTVKVVDFGVAKASQRTAETASGTVKGKVSYMSPEQCRGDEMDRRADLFSLGIVMWEMLTAHKLFRRAGDFETMTAIVTDDAPPPSSLRPEIAPEIDQIVMRLLAKDPAERFQTGNELHEAIEAAAVRTGSALSAASLARYMRELFGERPEPWIELQTHEHHLEAVTVTSEPIPDSLALDPAEDFDRKLSVVPALRRHSVSDADDRPPLDDLDMPTSPFDKDPAERPSMPPPMSSMPLPQLDSVPSYPVVTSLADSAFATSSSYSVAPHAPESSPSRSLVILAVALAAGAVIGIAIALSGGGSSRASDSQIALVPALPGVEPAADAATAAPADPEPPATEPAAPAPTVSAPPPATEPAKPAPTVSASPPVTEPAAAAPADPAPAPATEPVTTTPKARAAPRPKPKPDVATAFRRGDYAEVVALCTSSPRVLDANAASCTVAACKANQTAKARRWFSEVPASRKQSVADDCGSVLAVKKPSREDECKRDPMACQY